MSKFKVGDRVRLTANAQCGPGEVGTVIEFEPSSRRPNTYRLRMDGQPDTEDIIASDAFLDPYLPLLCLSRVTCYPSGALSIEQKSMDHVSDVITTVTPRTTFES